MSDISIGCRTRSFGLRNRTNGPSPPSSVTCWYSWVPVTGPPGVCPSVFATRARWARLERRIGIRCGAVREESSGVCSRGRTRKEHHHGARTAENADREPKLTPAPGILDVRHRCVQLCHRYIRGELRGCSNRRRHRQWKAAVGRRDGTRGGTTLLTTGGDGARCGGSRVWASRGRFEAVHGRL